MMRIKPEQNRGDDRNSYWAFAIGYFVRLQMSRPVNTQYSISNTGIVQFICTLPTPFLNRTVFCGAAHA